MKFRRIVTKKVLCILLSLLLVGLSACGGEGSQTAPTVTAPATEADTEEPLAHEIIVGMANRTPMHHLKKQEVIYENIKDTIKK